MTSVADVFPAPDRVRLVSVGADGGVEGRGADTSTCLHARARLPVTDGDRKSARARLKVERRRVWFAGLIAAADGPAGRVDAAWGWVRSEVRHLDEADADAGWDLVFDGLAGVLEDFGRRFAGGPLLVEEVRGVDDL